MGIRARSAAARSSVEHPSLQYGAAGRAYALSPSMLVSYRGVAKVPRDEAGFITQHTSGVICARGALRGDRRVCQLSHSEMSIGRARDFVQYLGGVLIGELWKGLGAR